MCLPWMPAQTIPARLGLSGRGAVDNLACAMLEPQYLLSSDDDKILPLPGQV